MNDSLKSGPCDGTSEEAVSACLDNIRKHNPPLNALVTLNPQALEEARSADRRDAEGAPRGPLHGVPIAVKDTYKTRGLRTTAGDRRLSGYLPEEDSVAVSLLRRAGAVIVGKGNTPPLAMDMQTDNPVFGRTNNPWDLTRTSGGSTGGDTVAVAAGMARIGFGSDLAGSLRIPTAYCGVYGLKTTYGVVSKVGHVPPVPGAIDGLHSLAVLGPVARSPEDLALGLEALVQPHPSDRSPAPLLPRSVPPRGLRELRVAWCDSFGGVPVAGEIRQQIRAFARALSEAGAQVTHTEPSGFPYEEAWETWGGLVAHQGGYTVPHLAKVLGAFFARGSVRSIPHQRLIIEPTSVARYMTLLTRQREHISKMDTFLGDYDAWICPVSSTTAFSHLRPSRRFGEFSVYDTPLVVDGRPVPYYVATQSYTTLFSETENPVISMPLALDSQGLPIGVQVVGRRYADRDLIEVVKLLDQCRPPLGAPRSLL